MQIYDSNWIHTYGASEHLSFAYNKSHNALKETSLVSRGVFALPLLGHVEAEVLQQNDGASGGVGAGGLHLGTDAVLQEGDVPAGVAEEQ